MDIPLTDFDGNPCALINAAGLKRPIAGADCCVITFFPEVVEKVVREKKAKKIGRFAKDVGDFPLYGIPYKGKDVGIYYSGIGAPLAVLFFEQAIAYGFKRFVACGGAGVLKKDIQAGKIVIPSSALRDEGTSFHYQPASRIIEMDDAAVAVLEDEMKADGMPYIIGRTWTTDAPYRETKDKINQRVSEGCLTVDMECSAFIAVSRFRNVKFGQYLYAGDDLSGDDWDHRNWTTHDVRQYLFWKSIDGCLKL
ncbi:MAG: nucleoside phosphorylase [Deltaproteobacteria bacterium]|nr:nucleoside phosphorylase [Deltaproteobacteria bacterium]